jgi:hypothetical protein
MIIIIRTTHMILGVFDLVTLFDDDWLSTITTRIPSF